MNIYNNDGKSRYKSDPKCGYCRARGHNATQCPRVAEDYAYFTQSPPVIPIGISTTPNTCSWYKTPKYWGEWHNNCINAYAKQQAAKKKASRTGTHRSASKCGFCGSTAHNRRNCDAMDQYTADAIAANRNWRRALYTNLVEQMGVSEGALLNLKISGGYNREDKDCIGIVTKVNWDELSLFCASQEAGGSYCYRDSQYRQQLKIKVQIDQDIQTVSFGRRGFDIQMPDGSIRNLVKYSGSRYDCFQPEFVSVLSSSNTPLDEEWIEEGHAKAMQFLTKKRSRRKLDELGITDLIKKWL